MALPIRVKSLAVSFTINPVTHTADVDVYMASMNVIPCEDVGIKMRRVPISIIAK